MQDCCKCFLRSFPVKFLQVQNIIQKMVTFLDCLQESCMSFLTMMESMYGHTNNSLTVSLPLFLLFLVETTSLLICCNLRISSRVVCSVSSSASLTAGGGACLFAGSGDSH